MLNRFSLAQLACRASNLSERMAILWQLTQANISPPNVPLTQLDTWLLKKSASKLALVALKQQLHDQQASDLPETQQDLLQQLTNYKQYEISLASLPKTATDVFLQPHALWLQIYQKALATLDLPKEAWIWREPSIYYGRFAQVCEPFLRLLQQRLQPTVDILQVQTDHFQISTQVIADIQIELITRMESIIARAIEADIKHYCYQNNISPEAEDTTAYIHYLEQKFQDAESYHRFYAQFPVLIRWLAQTTHFLAEAAEELLVRLSKDCDAISARFFDQTPLLRIESLSLRHSDPHAGGRSVVMIKLSLSDGKRKTIVYKPHCLQAEAAFQSILQTLTQSAVIRFSGYRVLSREGYGYSEFLSIDNQTNNQTTVEQFYEQLGGQLALFYILGGSDLHFENILVVGGQPIICDCETVLEAIPQRADYRFDTLFDSVFKTGMLDWPEADRGTDQQSLKLSASSGGGSYEVPFAIPKINHQMSLALAVEYQTGVQIQQNGNNRIYYKGQLIQPHEYRDCIVNGFNRVYNWFQQNSEIAIQCVKKEFNSSSVRFVNRATQVYAHLLDAVQHPKCLADPLEVDLVFYRLIENPRLWDDQGQLAALEIAALWQQDIPIFTAKATTQNLQYNYCQSLPGSLVISPVENAVQRIRKLSADNLMRQNHYILASFPTEDDNQEHFTASAINYAHQIGLQLCGFLQPASESAPWKTYEFMRGRQQKVDVGGSLYGGSAGICLFLAYLDSIQPEPLIRAAAKRALNHAISQCNDQEIGAFQGMAGLIYVLTHVAQLWQAPELLELAVNLVPQLKTNISQDRHFDVIHGAAGVIPVLLGLADATNEGIDTALDCAQHLLDHAIEEEGTLSWAASAGLARANLTGFSHGASGIGWALIRLGVYLQRSDLITAGRQAFAYEKTQFDPKVQNWYDLRTSVMLQSSEPIFAYYWCSGSAGIGLSRIDSWAALGQTDQDLLQEAYIALDATLNYLPALTDDALCHGKAGSLELLLKIASLTNTPHLSMEANVQATAQWRNFERARRWVCGAGGNETVPDLMNGLAGIGMQFLRLAHPKTIPSVLLLEAPIKPQ